MKRLFFSGNARLPQGLPAHELYETLSLSVECESRWGVIVKADCTLATDLGRQFVQDAFVGYSIRRDGSELARIIERRYHGAAQRALLAALRDLEQQSRSYWTAQDTEATATEDDEAAGRSMTSDREEGSE